MRNLVTANNFSRGTLDLRELFFILLKVVVDFLLLIALLVNVVASFFSILALGLVFQEFRGGLCLYFFLIDLVIRGLNLNVVLHAFF